MCITRANIAVDVNQSLHSKHQTVCYLMCSGNSSVYKYPIHLHCILNVTKYVSQASAWGIYERFCFGYTSICSSKLVKMEHLLKSSSNPCFARVDIIEHVMSGTYNTQSSPLWQPATSVISSYTVHNRHLSLSTVYIKYVHAQK